MEGDLDLDEPEDPGVKVEDMTTDNWVKVEEVGEEIFNTPNLKLPREML